MSKQGHQPQRFDAFFELKDKSGFTIQGSDHVFKYDKYGGWFDQYRNYYDKNGNPEDPPSDDAYSDEHSRQYSSENDDEFEKEFGRPKDYFEEEEDHTIVLQLQRMAANIEELNLYPNNGPFRVHFKNIGYFSKREQVFKWFKAKVPGISNLIFFNNEKGFNGRGYFIVDNIKAGEQLIKLQGQKYGDREVNYELESVEEFLLAPLEPHELKADFNQKGGKKYVKKSQAGKQETKQEVPPSASSSTKPVATGPKPKSAYVKIEENEPRSEVKVEVKPIKIQQKIIAPVQQVKVVENLEDFAVYTFKKKAFPKKLSFKQWLAQHNFTEADYKTVEKIPGNEEFAKITMKKKVYSKLNNTIYNGEKIEFRQQ